MYATGISLPPFSRDACKALSPPFKDALVAYHVEKPVICFAVIFAWKERKTWTNNSRREETPVVAICFKPERIEKKGREGFPFYVLITIE